ncbi:MAG: hypothetical protein RMJ19_10655 [Gemmatales bacterium]|nr:hypothetical protein [Gemmatales bacterium]MDW8176121.1 hypothetical protein [Gemmatales bacterium]
MAYIERKNELKRRRHRRWKIRKLRAKLLQCKEPSEAEAILQKIKKLSPLYPLDWLREQLPPQLRQPAASTQPTKK